MIGQRTFPARGPDARISPPIGAHPPGDWRQDMAGQILHLDPGKDEEAGVVGNERKIGRALLRRPADEPVAVDRFPRRRGEEHTCQLPAAGSANQIADVLAGNVRQAQVVVPFEQKSKQLGIGRAGAGNRHLQRRQFPQGKADGGVVVRCPGNWPASIVDGVAGRGKIDPPAAMQP